MQYRTLGKTGLKVSEVGFGAWAIGGNAHGNSYGPVEDTDSLAALNKAYDLGCTFFDTADVYGHGHSEEMLGKALKGWNRDEVVIATKGGGDFYSESVKLNFSEKHLRFAVEQSLKRLGTDHIDLYQLHNPPMPLIQHGRVFEVLQRFRDEGKIRYYGLSIHDPMEGIAAIDHGDVDTVQVVYNLFDRRPEATLFSKCQEASVGVIAREPLANSFLTGKYKNGEIPEFEPGDIRSNWPPLYLQKRIEAANAFKRAMPEGYPGLVALALRFVLASSAVSVTIPGCKTTAQAEENLGAAMLPPLTLEQLENLENVMAALA